MMQILPQQYGIVGYKRINRSRENGAFTFGEVRLFQGLAGEKEAKHVVC